MSDRAARRPWWLNYGAAVVIQVALTAFLTWLFPYFPLGTFPAPYAAALLVTVLVFGLGPAILALVLSLIAFVYFFVPPTGFAIPDTKHGWAMVAAYVLVTGTVVVATAAIQRGRHRAERLAESLQERSHTLDLAHVFVRDLDDVIIFWNRGAEMLLGFSKEEAVGRVSHDLLRTAFPIPLEAIREELFRTGEWVGELVHTKRDGTPAHVAAHWALHRDQDGNPVAIIAADNDISGRVQAQRALEKALQELAVANEELRESQERSRLAQDAANSGTWEWDLQTNENFWSEETWALYGLEPYSCEPSYAAWRGTIHPDDRAMAEHAVQEAAANETELSAEYRVLHRDGTERWLMSRGRPTMDADGQAVRYIGIVMDITDRKRAEERVRGQNAVLQAISHVFREALTSKTEADLGRICLETAEQLTQSRFGFIGEINAEGLFDDIAISDPGWAACNVIDPATGHRSLPADLKVHGIYGRVILDGKGFFSNDPASHPDSIGLPEGHTPLAAFLGVPLIQAGTTVGMVAVGNREGGYRQEDLEALEALASAMVEALMRKRAEAALLEAEAHRRDFYRQMIHAATEGKLVVCEREEIEKMAGKQIGAWQIKEMQDLGAVRIAATALARDEGIDGSRIYDFMGCVVESIGNAVKHAHGGRAALYRQDDSLLFVVSDSGPGIGAMRLPDVALTRGYTTAGTLGMGYKVMINFADKVYLATGTEGTTVALEMALQTAPAVASATV